MADVPSFAKLVPGFDFLQGLVKNAGAALPSIGQWVAPTLNPEELEKRIGELRTVQFWLEQNAKMLAATIQALEVQRMTLSTLKTMNVQMEDLRDSLQIRMPSLAAPAPPPRAVEPASQREPTPAAEPASESTDADDSEGADEGDDATPVAAKSKARPTPKAAAPKAAGPAAVDPLQWWGALTKQFTELAANAMKETAGDAARTLAGNLMKPAPNAATDSAKTAPAGAKAAAAKKKAPAKKGAAAKR